MRPVEVHRRTRPQRPVVAQVRRQGIIDPRRVHPFGRRSRAQARAPAGDRPSPRRSVPLAQLAAWRVVPTLEPPYGHGSSSVSTLNGKQIRKPRLSPLPPHAHARSGAWGAPSGPLCSTVFDDIRLRPDGARERELGVVRFPALSGQGEPHSDPPRLPRAVPGHCEVKAAGRCPGSGGRRLRCSRHRAAHIERSLSRRDPRRSRLQSIITALGIAVDKYGSSSAWSRRRPPKSAIVEPAGVTAGPMPPGSPNRGASGSEAGYSRVHFEVGDGWPYSGSAPAVPDRIRRATLPILVGDPLSDVQVPYL